MEVRLIATTTRGRPKSDNSKDYMLRIRLNEKETEMLDLCCNENGMDRSKYVRDMIYKEYEKLVSAK